MIKHPTPTLVLALALSLCGCNTGPKEPEGMKLTRPVPRPPEYPKAEPQPADPALRNRAISQLRTSAASQSAFSRAHAVEAARYLPPTVSRDMVLRALSDNASVVRFAALMASGELRVPQAAAPAVRLLDDQQESVQVAAIFALHRLGDTRFSHELEQKAMDPDRQVRADTALVLGLLGEPSAQKILRYQLRDNDPTIRLQASESLWRLGYKDALESLVIATISRYPDDQMIAAIALAGPRNPSVAEHLRGMLTSTYPEVALVAARAMGMIGSDEGYGVALAGARSDDPRQRQLAAVALGAIGRMDAQRTLGRLLDDTEEDVRIAAASSLLQLR